MLDRPVLARCVHPLEHDEDAALALGPEALLERGEAPDVGRDLGRRAVLVVPEGLAGVEGAEAHPCPGPYDELVAKGFLGRAPGRHGIDSDTERRPEPSLGPRSVAGFPATVHGTIG